jgi:phosphoglycolate phosphatase-like HAD superfamily hydrolase
MRIEPVFLFDLDGTLVDSVYQHVLAWKEALDAEGIELSVWRIHRKIGMSGGLFTNQLLRETGVEISLERVERLRRAHAAAYQQQTNCIRPLPGARELLSWLSGAGIPWAIATSGRMETAAVNLAALGVDPDWKVVTRDQVKHAKPDPDLFLAAAERLGAPIETAVVGEEASPWLTIRSCAGVRSACVVPGDLWAAAMPTLPKTAIVMAPARRS